jgi:hypothetical protein
MVRASAASGGSQVVTAQLVSIDAMANWRSAKYAGLILALVTAALALVTIIRFAGAYARVPCPDPYRMNGGWLCEGWQQWTRGGAFLTKSLMALQSDPTLQVMAAMTAALLVLVVWRRLFM